jgi:uncharacterized protein
LDLSTREFRISLSVIGNTLQVNFAVTGELLLDTGALVGLLDRRQSVHAACSDFYSRWDGAIVTSEAVITESAQMLSAARGGTSACIDFILQANIAVFPSTDVSLKRCRQLIEKYSGLPMDFADATLVVIAEELDTNLIFTVDHDFQVYRIHGRKPFRIVPE